METTSFMFDEDKQMLKVTWPNGQRHVYFPAQSEHWFRGKLADFLNSTFQQVYYARGPVDNSAKVGGRSNALHVIAPMLSWSSLLYNINAHFSEPLPYSEVRALVNEQEGPMGGGPKVGGRNNALHAIAPMLSNPDRLYRVNVYLAKPLPKAEVDALVKEQGPASLQCSMQDGIIAFCDLHGVSITFGKGKWVCYKDVECIAESADWETFMKLIEGRLS